MDSAVSELLSDPAAAQQTAEAFQRLKPVCSQLLYRRNEPQQLQQALGALQSVLADIPPKGLLRCFDYVTYPLLFMVDSIAATRAPPPAAAATSSNGMSIAVPAAKNDRAAEAVLDCLLLLLQRVGSSLEPDQVLLLLQRLASVLQLTQEQATEEVLPPLLWMSLSIDHAMYCLLVATTNPCMLCTWLMMVSSASEESVVPIVAHVNFCV